MKEKEIIHIQSDEARNRTINRFCILIASTAFLYFFVYIYLKIYPLSIISLSVSFLFSFFVYLNKKEYYQISRSALIITTNIEVLIFSGYLGFNSGIYLYLFAAPLLVYLLFDFNQTKTIWFYLSTYVITFFLIFFNDKTGFFTPIELKPDILKIIYACNFLCAFFMCFILVLYFATNNYNFILKLTGQRDLLQKNLKERELLLSEIHHRVKNNLAVVSALLELQTSYVDDEKLKSVIIESKNRIKSIALLHEKLYQNKILEKIDIKEYTNELVNYVKQTFNYQDKTIEVILDIDPIRLNMDMALPLSLIINELVTNSYKHAFKNQDQGTIKMSILQRDDKMHFSYEDNGQAEQPNKKENISQFGLTLIEALAFQLDPGHTMNNKGYNFEIAVKVI